MLKTISNLPFLLLSSNIVFNSQKRNFVRLLTAIANKPDRERIKVIGAERACAEWLLRCGGAVKWDKGARWLRDYNSLPSEGQKFFPHIQEVLLDGASVMDVGFEHFDGCKQITNLVIRSCPYITDNSLSLLAKKLKHSLEVMTIENCGDVTDAGIMHIKKLSLLKNFKFGDLPEVKHPENCIRDLKKVLERCEIIYEGNTN